MSKKFINLFLNKNEIFINIKNVALYFLGSILQSILAVIAQPIYSLHLSAHDFGILGYFSAIQNVLTPIFIFGMTSVYLMNYFKQTEEDNKKLLFNLTFFLFCFNSIIMLISYISIYFYFNFLQVNIPLNPFALFIIVTLLLDNFKNFVLINFRIRKRAFAYFYFSALNSILNFLFGILFVAYLNLGPEGRMGAPIISSIIMLPFSLNILKKYSTINFNFSIFVKATRVAFPLVLSAYAFIPTMNIDRFFLERLNNLSEFGLYNIGITIAGYVQVAFIALGSAFEPDIFKNVAQKNYLKLFKIIALIFIPYLFSVFVFFLLSTKIIFLLTAGKYIESEIYTNIALIAVFLMGGFYFCDKIFIALGKTKLSLYVNILGGISSFIIMYFAVNKFEFIGAAYGKIFIAMVMLITSSLLAIKYLKQQRRSAINE